MRAGRLLLAPGKLVVKLKWMGLSAQVAKSRTVISVTDWRTANSVLLQNSRRWVDGEDEDALTPQPSETRTASPRAFYRVEDIEVRRQLPWGGVRVRQGSGGIGFDFRKCGEPHHGQGWRIILQQSLRHVVAPLFSEKHHEDPEGKLFIRLRGGTQGVIPQEPLQPMECTCDRVP